VPKCIIHGEVEYYYAASPIENEPYSEGYDRSVFIDIGIGVVHKVEGIPQISENYFNFYILNPDRPRANR